MNRTVSLALWTGTLVGVGLCAAATFAAGLAGPALATRLARAGVIAILLTPPLRLAVAARGFWSEGARRHAFAAATVLAALVVTALRASAR